VACVQLAPDTSPSEEEIITHCKQTLGGFETPKRVMVTQAFPMTSTGKVRKVELRQEYSKLFT
jgi:long-chain acyl-CoA synthetase